MARLRLPSMSEARSHRRRPALLLLGVMLLLAGCSRDFDSGEFLVRLVIGLDMREGHRALCDPDVVSIPVVFNTTPTPDQYISMIYIGDTACIMRFPLGAQTSTRIKLTSILRPQGTIRVLVAGIDRDNSSLKTDFASEWVTAQNAINQDHQQYAASIGLSQPILQFANTNIIINANDLGGINTYNAAQLRTFLASKGHNPSAFDVVMVLDLDPAASGGGQMLDSRTVGMRWFFAAQSGFVNISPSQWLSLARASYHHEVGHLHGWGRPDHAWPSGTGFNFITVPELYGWTDLDGDGVVEILDPTPYGT